MTWINCTARAQLTIGCLPGDWASGPDLLPGPSPILGVGRAIKGADGAVAHKLGWLNSEFGLRAGSIRQFSFKRPRFPPDIIRLAIKVSAHGAVDGPFGLSADRVLVLKGQRRILLLDAGKVVRSYRIALGRDPDGHKRREGDGRTPEGIYALDWRNSQSRFYRSIHLSYPNRRDRAQAQRLGVSPGGQIMIHGLPNGLEAVGADHAKSDWTEGCIAVTNAEMDDIWHAVGDGTVIEIRP